MAQVARNLTDAAAGPLTGLGHMIVDRDPRYRHRELGHYGMVRDGRNKAGYGGCSDGDRIAPATRMRPAHALVEAIDAHTSFRLDPPVRTRRDALRRPHRIRTRLLGGLRLPARVHLRGYHGERP